ncbi:NH(3)-dependent NAD(+) synthetase [Sporobacter termitidis DSM 10068]|uniref:Glutamine-dependent NAD(+) synthetase n=1 Tax=Sporobacter termitidis DSM 10068 TaxID=1123282 RepID=A0A1M5ZBN7_9FIRM|nr:NAD(+) synthase [Sporobacter termitidis]SHI21579.1 NH(3)-dependent NAD(+) synthetase [Sporobacter termitidis DSM 10068]
MILEKYGYLRVAAAVPRVTVGNAAHNAREIVGLVKKGAEEHIKVMAFPELSVTGYTCSDLFHQRSLLNGAAAALRTILDETADVDMLVAVGMPVEADNQLFNCAVVLHAGKILGAVPKTFIPNYNEFYEKRWFASSVNRVSDTVRLCGADVPFGENILFKNVNSALIVGLEICEDLWMPIPPSSRHALFGANLLLNLSASNETVTKSDYRRELVRQQSARCYAGYVYCSAGQGESTTDVVFNGHALIAVNDSIVRESSYTEESTYIFADMDIEKLMSDRRKFNTFMGRAETGDYRTVAFDMKDGGDVRESFKVDPQPFIPRDRDEKFGRCREIFKLQSVGLLERMRKTGIKKAVIGLSGGLDSTLALLVTSEAVRALKLPPESIIGVTMPGLGTTDRTYQNALTLMRELGVTKREISIKEASLLHYRDIGHAPDVYDVTFENVQARERTQILMDVANQEGGLVIGTGDLSELALGWCTYNGDHMSHYGVNCGVPKSLVKHLVSWYAETAENKAVSAALYDILETPISPELLPADDEGQIAQKTEDVVGPYELHDFYLYHFLRNGFAPAKILKLASIAFDGKYEPETIKKWLNNFYRRFFSQQFKRSCLPDGVKVGSVCLSPRGDWRMPSDASAAELLQELEEAEA